MLSDLGKIKLCFIAQKWDTESVHAISQNWFGKE